MRKIPAKIFLKNVCFKKMSAVKNPFLHFSFAFTGTGGGLSGRTFDPGIKDLGSNPAAIGLSVV